MIFRTEEPVTCIAVPEPKAWEYNGRSGIAYKVSVSDGASLLQLPVSDVAIFNLFQPFHKYDLVLEVSQVAQDSRMFTKSRVVDASEAL